MLTNARETNRLAGWAALVCSLLTACGGDDAGRTAEPLPVGAGLYFTNGVTFGNANFYRIDPLSGDTALASVDEGKDGFAQCPPLEALDLRPDGLVLGVGHTAAALYEADVRSTLCRQLAPLPEVMRALAVRTDGAVFTVSATNRLYRLDAQGRVQASPALLCASGAPTCPVTGIDFSPDGTLYAIVSGGLWSRIDPVTGQLTSVKSGVGLSDDFDIDTQGRVRALAGDELRTFDLAGNAAERPINVFGGTAFATGVVYR